LRVSCIGCGVIGSSWALLFAVKGCKVNIYDVDPVAITKSQEQIRIWLDLLRKKGSLNLEQVKKTIDRIVSFSNLPDAVKNVDYVQESVYEDFELKRRVFKNLSTFTRPSTIIASSTSGLSITELQKHVLEPERCITVHPINPPHLIPLVEIISGNKTSENISRRVYNFMTKLGKTPIKVRKDVPGFVFNRLSAALWREALDLLDNGVASVEDIDKAVYSGMGLRWAIMGPFLTYHLGGGEKGLEFFISQFEDAFTTWWKSLKTWTKIPKATKKVAIIGVKNVNLVKTKSYKELVIWRDQKLIELIELQFGKQILNYDVTFN
jgi:3-hydroxypropionate dehydrogenase (NADP+)